MKAYKIDCDDPDHGGEILFALRGKDLRGCGTENCDCPYIERHIARAPAFDKYAPGPVTISQYLAEGWYWTCSGCEGHVWGDEKYVILQEERIFCSHECVIRTWEREQDWVRRMGAGRLHPSMEKFLKMLQVYVESQQQPALEHP